MELVKLITIEIYSNYKKIPLPIPILKSISYIKATISNSIVIRSRGIRRNKVSIVSLYFVTRYVYGVKLDRFIIDSGTTLEYISP